MGKKKILLVEDEVIVAMGLRSQLRIQGYEVRDIVTTGEKAINSAEEERPDMVLIDVILKSTMTGIEAAREICSCYDIPVIFMTGCDDEPTRVLADSVKHVGYFIKPIDIEDLMVVIDRALHAQ